MNRTQLNGALLGAGVSDPRSFISVAVSAISSVVVTAYVMRYVWAAQGVNATASAVFNGIYQAQAAVTATATSVFSSSLYYAKYVYAAVTTFVSSAFVSYLNSAASSVVTAIATTVASFSHGVTVTASTTAIATAAVNFTTAQGRASADRTMVVPADDRTMTVT